jgi:hypothetical protein
MAWKLTLAGTDRTTKIHRPGSVWVDWVLNERATARFVCKPGFVPARFSEAVIYAQNGTTVLYGGLVNPRRSMAHEATRALYRTSVDCADYGVYADWCYQTKTYASPVTLKTVLTDLVTDKLSAYSITLHASQVTGPTLEAFAWTTMRVSDALRQLSERTGYVWMITSEKKLRMVVPGTDAAHRPERARADRRDCPLWARRDCRRCAVVGRGGRE